MATFLGEDFLGVTILNTQIIGNQTVYTVPAGEYVEVYFMRFRQGQFGGGTFSIEDASGEPLQTLWDNTVPAGEITQFISSVEYDGSSVSTNVTTKHEPITLFAGDKIIHTSVGSAGSWMFARIKRYAA